MTEMKRQPVITGLGIVSPIGVGADAFWKAAIEGVSGVRYASRFDISTLPTGCRVVAEVSDADLAEWRTCTGGTKGRFTEFALIASDMARRDAELDRVPIPRARLKVAVGTTAHGQADVAEAASNAHFRHEPIPPWASNEYPAHAAASHVAIAAHAEGDAFTVSTACAAGLDAVAWGADQIRSGRATAVLAGGTDAPLSALTLEVFHAAGVLTRWTGPPGRASRPFDRLRSGLVLGEGAAIVVIEEEMAARARGAHVYARVLGHARSTEGAHLKQADPAGAIVARVMAEALRQSDLAPRDIDHISAHGNAMRDYDIAETNGIKQVFGAAAWSTPASSLKSMCGQALSASSAMQVVAACLTLERHVVLPTINYEIPDPRCDLDYVPNHARVARVRTVLVHAHGLGGTHSALVLARPS